MKKLLALLLFVLSFSACQKVTFEHPQPRYWPAVPYFPQQIQGSYPIMGEKDGLVVGRKTIEVRNERTYTLGEDLILKRYQGYWIVSLQNRQDKSWDVYAVQDKRSIKTLQLQKSELSKINEVVDRKALKLDAEGRPLPLSVGRREFKRLLLELFTGIEAG